MGLSATEKYIGGIKRLYDKFWNKPLNKHLDFQYNEIKKNNSKMKVSKT